MGKISPVSIKYTVYANFIAQGSVEKPDVIGALFGQTEGLLGSELEMRELQKEGKIGRIEVDLKSEDGKTIGKIQIPSALDKAETALIGAAIETIDKIGPTDAKIEIERIEDVRGGKREYIVDRAKKLLEQIQGTSETREITNDLRVQSRISKIQEYGEEKLPAGDISGNEIIVVEGRADVVNLLKNGINNVIGMNGTNLPEAIKKLSQEKQVTLFVDGDRGGRLIAKNVCDNAKIDYIASAPDGKEVEELVDKEVFQALRKKFSAKEFFSRNRYRSHEENQERAEEKEIDKEKLKEMMSKIEGSKSAYLLNSGMEIIKEVSSKNLPIVLERIRGVSAIVMDGLVTANIVKSAEDAGIRTIAARNFAYTDTKIRLISL
ncbi:DNA primase [Candidatus Pacearchaeota archaeon]|nr:DNA primase [Candidatus Pacearchaeota archaeon]